MQAYWVSLIVRNTTISDPYICSLYNSVSSLEEALEIIAEKRKTIIVLSAWVDVFDSGKPASGKKTTIFHECYVNAVGNVLKN